MKKIIISIILLCLTASCGYTPMYSKSQIQKFNIEIIDFEGDREINNLIRSELKRYNDDIAKKQFKIIIKTKYEKLITAKDSTGAASTYELSTTVKFDIQLNNKNHIISLSETFNMDKDDNILDQNNYEKTIKKTFASSMVRNLLLRLPSIK